MAYEVEEEVVEEKKTSKGKSSKKDSVKLPTRADMKKMTDSVIDKYAARKREEEETNAEFEELVESYYDENNDVVGELIKKISAASEMQSFYLRHSVPISLIAFLIKGGYTVEEIPEVETDKIRDLSVTEEMLKRWYRTSKKTDFSIDCRIFWN